MIDESQIELAVLVQNTGYRLLRWTQKNIGDHLIPSVHAHKYLSQHEAAEAWIELHYGNFPPDCRPPKEHMQAFGQYFASYLMTSFDIDHNPELLRQSFNGRCFCEICSYLSAAPHLKAKRLTRGEKQRAEKLKTDTVHNLAAEWGREPTEELVATALAVAENAEAAAVYAYTQEVLRRCEGLIEGPAVLALWRCFAWNELGSPKKNFEYTVPLVTSSIDTLKRSLCA